MKTRFLKLESTFLIFAPLNDNEYFLTKHLSNLDECSLLLSFDTLYIDDLIEREGYEELTEQEYREQTNQLV